VVIANIDNNDLGQFNALNVDKL